MTKPPIRIEVDDREVRQALENLQRRVSDLTPVMHDIGQALVEGMRARLRDGRDVEGRPFAPNSPVTLARKKGTRPLVDSGMMASQRSEERRVGEEGGYRDTPQPSQARTVVVARRL